MIVQCKMKLKLTKGHLSHNVMYMYNAYKLVDCQCQVLYTCKIVKQNELM